MKRYNCTLSDKRGAFGLCMEEHKEGAFVPFSEVGPLKQRINQLLEERSRTGLDIDRAILCGKVPEKNGLKSRLELLVNHHKRELALESLLREARSPLIFAMEESSEDKSVAIEELIDSIDSVLAGKVLERIGSNALAMMMDELHDICVGLDAPGGAQNGAEAWEQVKEARDRVLASLNHGRPDTEWTDAATSPASTDYRELQEQHDQLQSKYKAAMELLRETRPSVNYQMGMQRSDTGHREEFAGLLSRIDAMLSGQVPSPAVPEGLHLIYIGEIEVSHKWWINSKSDFFHPSENADFSDWPDGVNKLFRIAASPRQQGGEPCDSASPSSSPA